MNHPAKHYYELETSILKSRLVLMYLQCDPENRFLGKPITQHAAWNINQSPTPLLLTFYNQWAVDSIEQLRDRVTS